MFDKHTFQVIVTKLDLNAVTLSEAKKYAERFGAKPEGRTKAQFIKSLAKQIEHSNGYQPDAPKGAIQPPPKTP